MAEDSAAEDAGEAIAAPDVTGEVATGVPAPEVTPVEKPVYKGTGVSAALVVGVLLAIIAIIVAVQNTDSARVNFLAWDLDAPLVAVILAAAVAGVLLDEIAGFFWRRRRRRHLAERAELRRFRRG